MRGQCSHVPLHTQLECQNSQFIAGPRLLHKVRKRLFCDSSRVTLPGIVASLVSCSTKTTEPLSQVCSCTQPKDSVGSHLATLCLCQSTGPAERCCPKGEFGTTGTVCASFPFLILSSLLGQPWQRHLLHPWGFWGRQGRTPAAPLWAEGEAVKGTNLRRYSHAARQGGL